MSSSTAEKLSSSKTVTSGLPSLGFRSEIIDTNPWREKLPTQLMRRPAWGKLGKSATVNINSYQVTNFPTKSIWQYDVRHNTKYVFVCADIVHRFW